MNSLSKEKLNLLKNNKKLTNAKISQLTDIPISNIDKIFSGTNKNPTLDTIQKIAQVLDCSIDDFINYTKNPVRPVYIDSETEKLVNTINQNQDLKAILEVVTLLNDDDLKLLLTFARRLK